MFEPDFLAAVDVDEPLAMLREAYQRTDSASSLNRMMHLDLKLTLADNDLRKVSRMCDVAGVEVRYPLLDDELVEFSGEIPAALKVKGLELGSGCAITRVSRKSSMAASRHLSDEGF